MVDRFFDSSGTAIVLISLSASLRLLSFPIRFFQRGAVDAILLVHRPQLSAPGAPVLLVLLPDEFLQTIGLKEGQIFQHAHVVSCAVPLVQRLEPFAGI